MRKQHISAAIKDACDCALIGQFDTARALLDHAEELATGREPSGQAAHLVDFMESNCERTNYTAHLTELAA